MTSHRIRSGRPVRAMSRPIRPFGAVPHISAPEEGVKNVFLVGRGNSDAFITNGKESVFAGAFETECDCPAWGRVFNGIGKQIEQDVPEQGFIAARRTGSIVLDE